MKKFLLSITVIACLGLISIPAIACEGDDCEKNLAVAGATVNVQFPDQKDLTRTQIDAKGYRGFNNAAEINYPNSPGYFGTAVPGSSFQSIKTGLIYKDVFTTDELVKMSKDATINGKFGSKVIVTPLVDEVKEADKSEFMKVLLRKPGEDLEVTVVGYITVRATSKNTVSMEVLAEAALAARDLGADVIHVTAEGVNRKLTSFGWGIGLSYTRASISDTEQGGGVAAGGTGISGGSAAYVDMPWFQIFALKVK